MEDLNRCLRARDSPEGEDSENGQRDRNGCVRPQLAETLQQATDQWLEQTGTRAIRDALVTVESDHWVQYGRCYPVPVGWGSAGRREHRIWQSMTTSCTTSTSPETCWVSSCRRSEALLTRRSQHVTGGSSEGAFRRTRATSYQQRQGNYR